MIAVHAPWDPAVDDVFVCSAIRQVADETVTVVFAPRRPSTLQFAAGQHVTIEFDVDGSPVNRCYTIASPPTRPARLAITVRRTDGGAVTRWIHDGGLRVGDTVRVGEPQGSFTMADHPADAYLLLTAGSGITPALSMLRELFDLGQDADVVLVHSQRRLSQVADHDELRMLTDQLPGLRTHFVCTEVGGRLREARLRQLVPDLATRETLVCGPDVFREAMRAAVVAAGLDERRMHEESYTFDVVDPRPSSEGAPLDGDVFTIEFTDCATSVPCAAGTTILEAAMSAGLDVASSCTQGLCGTCKSTLTSGEVDMHHAGGIRPREIAAGKILLCCSRPLTDLVIAS